MIGTTVQKTVTAKPKSTTPHTTSAPSPPTAPSLVRYETGTYTARRPAGWVTEADDSAHGGYYESKWRDPADSNSSVLIDYTPGLSETAGSSAAGVRAATRRTPGYREFSYRDTSLAGNPAIEWVFEVNGDRRIDYFVNSCDTEYAILGSTSPGTFDRYSSTFRGVAESVADKRFLRRVTTLLR